MYARVLQEPGRSRSLHLRVGGAGTALEKSPGRTPVASMGVAYVESRDRVALWAEQLIFSDDDDDSSPATSRFQLTRGQVLAFVTNVTELVTAGRPPCTFCAAHVLCCVSLCFKGALQPHQMWCPVLSVLSSRIFKGLFCTPTPTLCLF